MIKTASALSLAFLLFACGGGGKATKTEPAGGDPTATPAGETAPDSTGDAEKASTADPAAEPAAVGSTPHSDADVAAFTEAEWEQAVIFAERLADVALANKADCDQMAAALKTLFDESEELIARANKWQQNATEEEQQRFGEMYQDRLQAMGMKLGEGLQACSSHAGVMAQFERFQ